MNAGIFKVMHDRNSFLKQSTTLEFLAGQNWTIVLMTCEKINCHMAQEIGCTCISKIIGNNFYTVKFKRNDRMKTTWFYMSTGIPIDGEIVPTNPLLI